VGNCRKGVIHQPQQGERKDAGGADFVPLPLNAPLYICSVQVRFGIYLSELSGKPKYFYGKWSII